MGASEFTIGNYFTYDDICPVTIRASAHRSEPNELLDRT